MHELERCTLGPKEAVSVMLNMVIASRRQSGKTIRDAMPIRGDTRKQAVLRDHMIKKRTEATRSPYISRILSVLKPKMKLIDIGCGTAHIIQELASVAKRLEIVGLDLSRAMIDIAKENLAGFHNVVLLVGDGLTLPFPDQAFDVVITRLAVYAPEEAYRILKKGGFFLEFGLGPDADREILEFFPERIDTESFFFPCNPEEWKQEISQPIERAGFTVTGVYEYKENDYYGSLDELIDLIELVPLVNDFNREKDRIQVAKLARKYGEEGGIKITWHYCITVAMRPLNPASGDLRKSI